MCDTRLQMTSNHRKNDFALFSSVSLLLVSAFTLPFCDPQVSYILYWLTGTCNWGKSYYSAMYTARPIKKSFWLKSADCCVMTWGCFSWSGLGIVDFLNVLNDQVIPSMDFFFPGGSGIFQDDNAKIHPGLVAKEWSMRTHEGQGARGVVFTHEMATTESWL